MSVADSSIALDELVDLKMLPAWANESMPAERYAHVDGEEQHEWERDRPSRHRPDERREKRKRLGSNVRRRTSRSDGEKAQGRAGSTPISSRRFPPRKHRRETEKERPPVERVAPQVAVRFLPRAPVLENVIAQIKEEAFAYSLFALARLFLAKAERYQVHLAAAAQSPLFQLGENGAVAADRDFLERSAFRLVQSDFYKIEITQRDPIKGNFTSIARDRLSGAILGPTNHHDYQKRLRGLYEQRFSRRMSFADYQRQIEIVTDPQLVEQWKEEARKITTYSTLREEPPVTFASAAETERHFRERYLPNLIRTVTELTIDGLTSRRLPDRSLYRLIENEWTNETRSPSRMMQELATQFRQSGLHVFRHRRGMLFISPIRSRPLVLEGTPVSSSVKAIIETLAGHAGTNRKELAEKILADLQGEELERAKLALASDLHWLISEGHIIEFNDGALDLPRLKAKQPERTKAVEAAVPAAGNSAEADAAAAPVLEVSADQNSRTSGPARESSPRDESVRLADFRSSPKRPVISEEEAAEIGGS